MTRQMMQLFSAAVMSILMLAAPALAQVVASASIENSPAARDQSIRPFHADVSDEALADLRRRIAATRWPEKETVTDATQGVQLATMQKLAQYWGSEYDWRKCQARLDAIPQ